MGIVFICINGCSVKRDVLKNDPFRRLYDVSVEQQSSYVSASKVSDSLLTFSASDMPLSLLCRILSDKFSVGVVFSQDLADRKITAEFKEADIDGVFNIIARQVGADSTRLGSTFFLGSLRSEDRAVFVRRQLGYSKGELTQIVSALLSQTGKVNVTDDGVVVVSDHANVLLRLAESFDFLDRQDSLIYIVQLYFVVLRKDALISGGLATKSSGKISYDVANSKLDFKDFNLDAVFSFDSSSSLCDTFSSPMFLLRSGSTGTWQDGERVPIPRKSVSDYGTVTTVGFDYVDTGFIVNVTPTSSRNQLVSLKVTVDVSDINSYVEYAPVTSVSKYMFDADLQSDQLYLVGEFSTYKKLDSRSEILSLSRDTGKSTLQLWAKVYRVSAGVGEGVFADSTAGTPAGRTAGAQRQN